ncbi:MAG: nucleoside deaminase [Clostridia bacterium]|nr:nucleoside deaminase [Clostridia bacterium]
MEEIKKQFMLQALEMAKKAYKKDEVPVGAIIVRNGKVVSRAYNSRERKQNALHHAEILAINKACKKLKSFRLDDCEMYVTLEPCPMCSGAIVNARLKKVYFGCPDFNYGCAGSKYNFLQDKTFEHLVDVEGGLLSDECSSLIKNFFVEIRQRKKDAKKISK